MLGQKYDIACTYCVPNLSNFNKTNRDFLQNFKNKIFLADIFPIVVKHIYTKNYLVHKHPEEIIIGGDRDVIQMTDNEKKVAKILYEDPTIRILDIAKKLKLNPKTITKIKGSKTEIKILQNKPILLLLTLKSPNLKKIQITTTSKKYNKTAHKVFILRKK